jgi:hypothetical protein
MSEGAIGMPAVPDYRHSFTALAIEELRDMRAEPGIRLLHPDITGYGHHREDLRKSRQ